MLYGWGRQRLQLDQVSTCKNSVGLNASCTEHSFQLNKDNYCQQKCKVSIINLLTLKLININKTRKILKQSKIKLDKIFFENISGYC